MRHRTFGGRNNTFSEVNTVSSHPASLPDRSSYSVTALEIVRGLKDQQGFAVQPKRWIVERTFGWLNRYRRLSKEYEVHPETSEVMILIAMTHVMVKRLQQ